MTPAETKDAIFRQLQAEGFDLAAVALPTLPAECAERYARWIAADHHAGVNYLARRQERGLTAAKLLHDVRSVIVVGAGYGAPGAAPPRPGHGRLSHYATFRDYHPVLGDRLRRVAKFIAKRLRGVARAFVDTGPVSERAYAAAAGLGWLGRNGMLITPSHGSWVFLGVILTTLELPPGQPVAAAGCGDCRRCLDACPTGALLGDGTLDSRRCLSHLTIEHQGELPAEWAAKLGPRLFGCDTCQEVCPHNHDVAGPGFPDFQDPCLPRDLPLAAALAIQDDESFRRRFAGTPVLRAKLAGFQRNCRALRPT